MVDAWRQGTLYNPGATVRRASTASLVALPPTNAGFEEGDTGWTKDTGWAILTNAAVAFAGEKYARLSFSGVEGERIRGQGEFPVTPGQSITARCRTRRVGGSQITLDFARVELEWLDEFQVFLSRTEGSNVGNTTSWKESVVTGVAPAGAAYVRIAGFGFTLLNAPNGVLVDAFSWNYTFQPVSDSLVFTAVQAQAGFSGVNEPLWPDTLGQTVVDNEVVWEAIQGSRVVWEANPILKSGGTEPTWPTDIGGQVVDNTIVWTAISRRVEDERCPNTAVVAIAASKIFCGDDDIIGFSATVNPLDWSSPEDAGYLPFGLQTYGADAVRAMGLYRGNLVAFNSSGFQMWQVDQDPANMALLDAVPIGCVHSKTPFPVHNDLVFLSAVGVRNIGIAGASTNLQAGTFGEAVDPLILGKLRDGTYVPQATFVPAYGQYWLFFGDEAFIMTISDTKKMSWSRYVFPFQTSDVTILDEHLYLRAENGIVVRVQDGVVDDDAYCQPTTPALTGIPEADYEYGISAMSLSWTASEFECGISGYSVLRSVNGGLFNLLAAVDGDTLAYVDNTVLVDAQYNYVVVAHPGATCGGIDSEPSNIATSAPVPLPELLGEVVYEDGYLDWVVSTVEGHTIEAYELYRSEDGGPFELYATLDEATLNYVDQYLSPDVVYSYYVVAVAQSGLRSGASNVIDLEFSLPPAGPIVLLTDQFVEALSSSAGANASAGYGPRNEKIIRYNENGAIEVPGEWLVDQQNYAITDFEFRATHVSGDAPNLGNQLNTWLPLVFPTFHRLWENIFPSGTGPGIRDGIILVECRLIGQTEVLDSAQIRLRAVRS